MRILRTPEACFEGLPDFPFAPHYVSVSHDRGPRLRMHYVDEGPRDGRVVLLLHGEPSWSYLYRKMIPLLAAAGRRVVAPDHIGFGRSDKPAAVADYTYQRHIAWGHCLVRTLDLRDITLFCQDWGGPIGLSLVAADPARFAAVVAANTVLPTAQPPPTGEVDDWPGAAISAWIETARSAPTLPIGRIVQSVTLDPLPDDVVAAYDAPFPDESYKAGARAFPQIIPIDADSDDARHNRTVWAALEEFDKPFLTAFSDGDPTTAAWGPVFQRRVPGARGLAHASVRGGHFLQEDAGPELTARILAVG
jgi:haloalkane dehalogenase